MITFMETKEKLKDVEKCLDPQLWHACAGGMVQTPTLNSKVFYFPQGHAEHACGPVDFRNCPRIPPYILCRVSSIKFMADPETDEVFAKFSFIPSSINELDLEGDDDRMDELNGPESQDRPASFAKTLTQSDANNGGGFSVPRYCAETIFPRLDYTADPPVQTILAKDVHGETWKFRHIYRGTPRRHLLTTGWSTFVNQKKLIAGDSIVFLRAENGDLCIGIRRAKRGVGGGPESSSGWNPAGGNYTMPYGGFTAFLREDESKLMRNGTNVNGVSSNGGVMGKRKVRPESVIEAATLAAKGQPFGVVYYPRASTPEFCVKASLVKTALKIRWCSGMRFKMAFETEDSSRISWFMGTISSVQVADPILWPESPWRLLQVTWDEPDLLQNVKRVSPWLVELVSNMPAIHMSPFLPPRKKLRLLPHPEFPLDGSLSIPGFPRNLLGEPTTTSPFGCLPNNTPAGMQGARHAHHGLSLSDLHLNKLQSGLFSVNYRPQDHSSTPIRLWNNSLIQKQPSMSTEDVSCLLTIACSTEIPKKSDNVKTPPRLVLFGQPILTEQQISKRCSGTLQQESESSIEKTDVVGHSLDLSLVGSFDELQGKLVDMCGRENPRDLETCNVP